MRNGTIAKQEEILIVPSPDRSEPAPIQGKPRAGTRVPARASRASGGDAAGRSLAFARCLDISAGHGKRGSGVIVVAIRDWRATETVAT